MTRTEQSLLDAEQIALFHAQGFLRLPRLTSPAEAVGLRTVYDRLFDAATTVADGDRLELAGDSGEAPRLPQVLNPDRYAPELRDTHAYRAACEVARLLLGDDAEPDGMHAICKPPHDGAATPWHQDEAYWDPRLEHRALSIWMPLQEATLENGCLQFVPGSHLDDVRPHRLIDPDAHGLRLDSDDDVEGTVACPLPPGGATVHLGRTLHYAGPNRSDEPRRALIMAFAAPTRPLETPRAMPWQRPEWSA